MPKHSTSKFEELWAKSETAIRRYARIQARYKYQAWRWGRPVDELEERALLSWVWVRLIESRPQWIQTPDDLTRYFISQIRGRVSNLTRPRSSLSGGMQMVETEVSPDRPSPDSPEDPLLLQDFVAYVSRQSSHLNPLLHLMLAGVDKPAEQAKALETGTSQVYQLRYELRQAMVSYMAAFPARTVPASERRK